MARPLPSGTEKTGMYLQLPEGGQLELPRDAMRPDVVDGDLPDGALLDNAGYLVVPKDFTQKIYGAQERLNYLALTLPTERHKTRVAKSWRDKYTLDKEPLGEGGQAQVMRATDRGTDEVCALKRLLYDRDHDGAERMRREIETLLSIEHRNVMPVLVRSRDFDWYTMPVAGRVLVDEVLPIDGALLREIVTACCGALVAGHGKAHYHRDITPGNVFHITYGQEPRWVLGDWGLVRRAGRTTIHRTGAELGTMGFAAPEMLVDPHGIDHRADIYSLGRVIAWAVTGAMPEQNVALRAPGPWADFVEAATQHKREDRPPSVQDLLSLAPAWSRAAEP